ncbi:MAG: DNA repair protein RadA [Paludibacteraceae bacterium]|nr:DNA repair protein RadA [Paludibacteraceae bacterium]MEE1064301.1 DNA repair protein RadA [Paludibacteraceae bacterium]
MAKLKSVFFCQNCGNESSKWLGRCPACGEWNTFVEEVVNKAPASSTIKKGVSIVSANDERTRPVLIENIEVTQEVRFDTKCAEFNRVLGGGLVPGSMVLIGGEPGIGKSTLVLQVVLNIEGKKTLYVSGEESLNQLKMRAERLGSYANKQCYFVSDNSLERIFTHIKNVQPELLIIDSIQTIETELVESAAGSVSQVRECAAQILRYAKESNTPVLMIGHITKDGTIAGPKILEHIVDTVIQFEGDQHYMYRILRAIKNRFGSTSEIGIFEMQHSGLREVSNPSEMLMSHNNLGLSGTAIGAMIEGIRPLLIEVQALVSTAAYGTPQRSATGFDARRLNMLLAVLEKRVGFKLSQKDVFLNIAGGLKVSDPALDLAVISAILSSNMDIAIDPSVCLAGEIGLTGEIRPINRIEQRISEAEKLGFKKIVIPRFKNMDVSGRQIQVLTAEKVEDAFKILFA